jgi:hypothetical protein
MSMLGYAVSSEAALSALRQPPWTEWPPDLDTSGLTKLEIDLLVIYWRE